MPITGRLREGAGGTGVATFNLNATGLVFVSSSIFGLGVSSAGTAIAACTVIAGGGHSNFRDPASEQLRLVALTSDGHVATQEDGPRGKGIWFEARGNDRFAIGQRDGRFVFVKHWGTPISEAQIADIQGANPTLANAILNGEFSAGIDPAGRLIVIGGNIVLAVERSGAVRNLQWSSTVLPSPASNIRQLVSPRANRMFVVSSTLTRKPKGRLPVILSFEVGNSTVSSDTNWGTNGVWTGPFGFEPADLLFDPNGSVVCVGWTYVAGGAQFTAIRIAKDGKTDNTSIVAGTTPQSYPFFACIDSSRGLLVGRTIPNILSVFLPNLAAMGVVARWHADGTQDLNFGNLGGVCLVQHLGYPVTVRGLVSTNAGFFLATDRPASIDSQFTNTRVAIFAFDAAGRPVGAFGETGIVLHDDIPTALQLHEASGVVAVGKRTVWGAPGLAGGPNTSELAVTTLGVAGNVIWTYGTTHRLQSAPVIINGQQSGTFAVTSVVRWGGLLAIGGGFLVPDGFPEGFVTIRDSNGGVLPGATTLVQTSFPIETLEALPNGTLEATFRIANGTFQKIRLVNTPTLAIDTTFPAAAVPHPSLDLTLPDGSTISPNQAIFSFFTPNTLSLWVTRELPNGTIDPAYGGGTAVSPVMRVVDITNPAFGTIGLVESKQFLVLPDGRFFLLSLISIRIGGMAALPQPAGVVATVWNSNDGSPSWTNPLVLPGFDVVTQVLIDGTDGVVLVGAAETGGTPLKAANLIRIHTPSGTLDPAFGTNGILRVPLRSQRLTVESQTAQSILSQTNGSRIVPVIFRGDEQTGPSREQAGELSLAWLDIT